MYSKKTTCILCYVLLCFLQLTQGASLRCYYGSLEQFKATPLHEPLGIMSCINQGLPTVVYAFGYGDRTTGNSTRTMLTAYISKGKRNVILLDWEEEAKSGKFGLPLGYVLNAVPNSKKVNRKYPIGSDLVWKPARVPPHRVLSEVVKSELNRLKPHGVPSWVSIAGTQIGRELGDALMKITAAGVNMKDIQLVGHSLGAQVMGFAGRRVREYGKVITRITGLDPARVLFEGVFALQGLDHTCARFVDIVHSDPGGYGFIAAAGTVDIWPNYSRNNGTQPGCPHGNFAMMSPEDFCSHERSWQFFAEALGAPTSFPCAAAENYEEWIAINGEVKQKIYLGDLTSMCAKGNFFLDTKANSPYAMGAKGMKPDHQTRIRTTHHHVKIF